MLRVVMLFSVYWCLMRHSGCAVTFKSVMDGAKVSYMSETEMVAAAVMYGRILWGNHIGIYRDDFFESHIFSNGKWNGITPVVGKRILHVISKPYATGGHTRLMERLFEFAPEESSVLVTQSCASSDNLRGGVASRAIFSEQGFSIREMAAYMAGCQQVCLHINPNDIKAAVAARIAKEYFGVHVVFVNHADHVFSYGYAAADVIAEVSGFGVQLSALHARGLSSFLGIPLAVQDFPQVGRPQGVRILSAASPLKYEPVMGVSFPEFARKLLTLNESVQIQVIGPQRSDPWWRSVLEDFPGRLQIFDALKYDQYIESVKEASLYIDSFPMTGGTALPEVRSMGVAVAGLHVGVEGYTPLDAVRCDSEMALIKDIEDYFGGKEGGIIARNNSESMLGGLRIGHGLEHVKQRFFRILDGIVEQDFVPERSGDMEFFEKKWLEKGLNLSKKELRWLVSLWRFNGLVYLENLFRLLDARGRRKFIFFVLRDFFYRYSPA